MQPRGIHHHEHRVEALARLTDDPGLRLVKAHHAGRAAVQAHLLFDAVAYHLAALAVRIKLGHEEQAQPLGAGRCIRQPRQHQVHDVVGEVVLAARDEDLGAAQQVAAVGLRRGSGACQAQIAARVRLGQAHRGQPLAGRNLRQIARLQLVAAVVLQAFVRAMQQAGRHGQAVVGRAHPLVQHAFEHRGQALTAVFGGRGQRRPARLPELLIGLAKARRHGDRAAVPLRADFVAAAVERGDHLAHKLAGFVQHLLH
jgi:hypothetical protein